jgi:hypothetical protein
MKERGIQVEGISFYLNITKHNIARKIIPGVKTCPAKIFVILVKHCYGVLLQIFNIKRSACNRRDSYILICNRYSTLPEVPELFPYFDNVCEVANIIESECSTEICMGSFKVNFDPKRKLDLFCEDVFFCEEIFTRDIKYSCIETLGKKGLTFSSKICGTVSICGSKEINFEGKRFVSYLEVTTPERFCNKRKFSETKSSSSSSSSSSSECCKEDFETPLVISPQNIIVEEKEDMPCSESTDIDEEEYFYIRKAPPIKNMFSNPFMPNWKLNDTRDVVDKFIEKKSYTRRDTNVSIASNTSVNVRNKQLRKNPLEPNNVTEEGNTLRKVEILKNTALTVV